MMLLEVLKDMIKSLGFWLGFFSAVLVISIIGFVKGDNATLRIEAVTAIIGLIVLACMGLISFARRIFGTFVYRIIPTSSHPHSKFYKKDEQ